MKDKRLLAASMLVLLSILAASAALIVGFTPIAGASDGPSVLTVEASAYTDLPIEVALCATGNQSEIVLYQLTEQPRLGTARIEGATLYYSPGHRTGTDRFCYTAVDEQGRTAPPAQISIRINKNRAGMTYADLEGDTLHYAALRLSEAGVMTGEQIGACYFFRPAQAVTRSEFIAMAAALADLPIVPTTQTDFADDQGLSPWAKPYVSAAAGAGWIAGYQTAGGLNEIRGQNTITMAEACVILNSLLTEQGDFVQTMMLDTHASHDWAEQAVAAIAALEVVERTPHTDINTPLTRRTACTLLYRTLLLLA